MAGADYAEWLDLRSSQANSCELRALRHESVRAVPDIADLIDTFGIDELGALDYLEWSWSGRCREPVSRKRRHNHVKGIRRVPPERRSPPEVIELLIGNSDFENCGRPTGTSTSEQRRECFAQQRHASLDVTVRRGVDRDAVDPGVAQP